MARSQQQHAPGSFVDHAATLPDPSVRAYHTAWAGPPGIACSPQHSTRAGPACLLGLPSVSHEHKFRSTENRPNRRVAASRPNKDAATTPPGEGVEFRLPALGLAYCPGGAVCGTTCSQPEGHSLT